MRKHPFHAWRSWLPTITACALLHPAVLAGQQSRLSSAASTQAALSQPVEIASLGPLPSAPEVAEPAGASANGSEASSMPALQVVSFTGPSRESAPHRFWDRENSALFLLNAGGAAADFLVTRANLASGGQELNPVTRIMTGSTPALAANFALETGGVIGVSYLFHKTGHHTLERLTSMVNFSGSVAAVAYGVTHR
jgi:hypothetical protein